jgi:hypothetical protein
MKIIQTKNDLAMAEFSKEQLELLETVLRVAEPRLYISEVNYDSGIIAVGLTFASWKEDNYVTVNVYSNNVPTSIKAVINKVYPKVS